MNPHTHQHISVDSICNIYYANLQEFLSYISTNNANTSYICFQVFGRASNITVVMRELLFYKEIYNKGYHSALSKLDATNTKLKVDNKPNNDMTNQYQKLDEHKVISIAVHTMRSLKTFAFDTHSWKTQYSHAEDRPTAVLAKPNKYFFHNLITRTLNVLISTNRKITCEVKFSKAYFGRLFLELYDYHTQDYSLAYILYLLQKYTDTIYSSKESA